MPFLLPLAGAALGGLGVGGIFGAGSLAGAGIGAGIGALTASGIGSATDSGPGGMPSGPTDLNRFGPNPDSGALSSMLSGMSTFQPVTPQSIAFTPNAYQAKDMSKSSLPQYDAMRERLNSQYSQTQGRAQDALDRQFAAAGGGPGNGAQAKQTENLASSLNEQKGNDLLGINAQEGATRTQLQQQEDQNAFQSGESQKGLGFQAQQFNAAAGNQAQQFNAQMGQNQDQFKFTAASTIGDLNLKWKEAQATSQNNEFNKQLALYQAKHSGGLLGGGGFLGLGF